MASLNTLIEIDDTNNLFVLNSDFLLTLNNNETDKIRLFLTAEDNVAHDRSYCSISYLISID
jgi:hypothetical protein